MPMQLNARKMLFIGLGSTGAKVCNQILERLAWTYHSPKSVPWLKCLVLETAPVPTEHHIHADADFLHLTITHDEYSNLISNPQNYQNAMAFSSWDIPDLTRQADAILAGAANTRILGRLAFLFPKCFAEVNARVTNALSDLNALTPQQAGDTFSRFTGEEAQVVFGDPNNTAAPLFVYVVGTLCGGTASGSFIDVGYYLRNLTGYRPKTTGIFLLPSTAEQNHLLVSNAYAALVELNHFSSDRTRYRVQYPTTPGVPREMPAGMAPYEQVYLAQPRGMTDEEFAKLITTTADYVYADAIGSSSEVRDAARVNIMQMFNQRDSWGATQKYFTFGMSTIEFPFAKVAKACTVRLANVGFRELAGGEPQTESHCAVALSKVPLLTRDTLEDFLLQRSGASLRAVFQQAISHAASEALHSDGVLSLIREQLNGAFDGNTSTPHPQLSPRAVPQAIEDNARAAAEELRTKLHAAIRGFISTDDLRGLQALESFLSYAEHMIQQQVQQTEREKLDEELAGLSSELDDTQERVHDCRTDFWLGTVGQRRAAVQRYIDEWSELCDQYYTLRLKHECAPMVHRLTREALQLVRAIRRRVNDPRCGMQAEVASIIAGMDTLYGNTNVPSGKIANGWTRLINGEELFVMPDAKNNQLGTVDVEYRNGIRDAAQRRKLSPETEKAEKALAIEVVHNYVERALDDLFADPHEIRRYDFEEGKTLPKLTEEELMRHAAQAQANFDSLRNKTINDRLMNLPQSKRTGILSQVRRNADLFLAWNAGHSRYSKHDNKQYGFVFYNTTDAAAGQLSTELGNAGITPLFSPQSYTDRHQILLIQEQGAFSLGTVDQLMDEMPSQWRDWYEHPDGVSSLASRGDITAWVSWSRKDEDARTHARNLYLVGIVTGVVQFVSALEYRFNYTPLSPTDPGFVVLRNDLDVAIDLLRHRNLIGALDFAISTFRREQGSFELVRRIIAFTKESDSKFTESAQVVSRDMIQSYLLDYVQQDTVLVEDYRQQMPDIVEASYQSPDPDESGLRPYVCPHCKKKLGYTADALYVQEEVNGRPARVKRCAYCTYDFLTHVVRDQTIAAQVLTQVNAQV